MSPSLSELIRRLRASDRTAFTALFHALHAPLLRYARRITSDEAAYDVLQDVFLKLWEDRETLAVQVSVKALLYTMVRNRALNINRRRQWTTTDALVEEVLDRHETARSIEETVETDELRRSMQRWIDDLPERRAEAFVLSRYHGFSHREVGLIMGVSERTVDTHILLALKQLRQRLDALQRQGTQP